MVKKNLKKTAPIKTKYGSYRAVFESESDLGGYAVVAHKVPGAISWGKNMKEARDKIREAIECCIEGDAIIAAEKAGLITILHSRIPVPA